MVTLPLLDNFYIFIIIFIFLMYKALLIEKISTPFPSEPPGRVPRNNEGGKV